MGGLMTPYEGEINLHGDVTVPYFVIGGGLLVLTEQGVENLIDAHFPSYPKEQLKGSQYYFEAGKHRGYMAEIVKDLYDYSPTKDEHFVKCLLTVGLAALIDDATKNNLTLTGGYSRLVSGEMELTKAEVKKLDSLLLKARDYHPKKKK